MLSDRKLPLIRGVETLMIPPCEKVGVSKDGTAANTLIFMQAWSVIYNDVRWQAHDWLIKADPDAVLLSDRLRNKLRPHTGQDVYLKNCNLYSGPAWPMMFGSLEAISIKAIERYFEGAERCKKERWGCQYRGHLWKTCVCVCAWGSGLDEIRRDRTWQGKLPQCCSRTRGSRIRRAQVDLVPDIAHVRTVRALWVALDERFTQHYAGTVPCQCVP